MLDDLLRRRVHSVAGHPEVYGRLLPTLLDVRKRLQAGEDFEAATFDRWAFHGGDHFRTPAESLSSTEDQVASEDRQSAVDSPSGEGLLGQDLSEEPDQAFADLRARAEAGDAGAQLNLGLMYDTGQGVPQDYFSISAHAWVNLAASRSTDEDRENAVKARDILAARMTPDQLAEAQRRAREWDAAHPQQ